jgi:hypothetical protein
LRSYPNASPEVDEFVTVTGWDGLLHERSAVVAFAEPIAKIATLRSGYAAAANPADVQIFDVR